MQGVEERIQSRLSWGLVAEFFSYVYMSKMGVFFDKVNILNSPSLAKAEILRLVKSKSSCSKFFPDPLICVLSLNTKFNFLSSE